MIQHLENVDNHRKYELQPVVDRSLNDVERVTVRDARAYLLHLAGWRVTDIAAAESVTGRCITGRIERARDMIKCEEVYIDALQRVTRALPLAATAIIESLKGNPGDRTGSVRLKAATFLLETVGIGPKSTELPSGGGAGQAVVGQGLSDISGLSEDELDTALLESAKRIVSALDRKQSLRDNEVQVVDCQDVTDVEPAGSEEEPSS